MHPEGDLLIPPDGWTPDDGRRRENRYALVVTQEEVVELLARTAQMADPAGLITTEFEVTDEFIAIWHDLYRGLDAHHRFLVEASLEAHDLRSPGACRARR